MRFKRIVFAVSFLVAAIFIFNFTAPNAKAVTSSEIQELIAKLQQQIADLQRQLKEKEGQPEKWCYDFNANLRVGDEGSAIAALQTALKKEGLLDSITNEFDEETAAAVVEFQEEYKNEILTPAGLRRGTGFVGKATRAKLNKIYGCGLITPPPVATATPSITVLSPSGGETWTIGGSYTVKWTTANIPASEPVAIFLVGNQTSYELTEGRANAGDGAKTVTIPMSIPVGSLYKVEIVPQSDNKLAATFGRSNGYISIVKTEISSITVLSPNGGETWQKGTLYNIAWNAAGVDKITIFLADFSESQLIWHRISPDLSATPGKYSWKVADCYGSICDFKAGNKYKIKVSESSSSPNYPALAEDNSDSYFSIAAAPATVVCTDTDGGKDIYTKGTVQGWAAGDTMVTETDFCSGNNLIEYYCVGSYRTNDNYSCANGCSNGACKAAPAVGSLSLSLGSDTPPAQNVVINTTDVEFLKVKFSAGANEDVRVNSIKICGTTAVNASNIKILDGSTQIGASVPFFSNDIGCADFTNLNWVISKSSSRVLSVRADATAAESIALSTHGGLISATGASSGLAISSSGSALGNAVTIIPSGSLLIALDASSPLGQIAKSTNAELLRVAFTSNNEDARIGSLKICAWKAQNSPATDLDIAKLSLYEMNIQIGLDGNFVNGCFSFTNLNWVVGRTSLVAKGDISSSQASTLYLSIAGGDITASGVTSGKIISAQGSVTGGILTLPVSAPQTITASLNLTSGWNYFSIPVKEEMASQKIKDCAAGTIVYYFVADGSYYSMVGDGGMLGPGTGYTANLGSGASSCSVAISGTPYTISNLVIKANTTNLIGSSYKSQTLQEIAGTCDINLLTPKEGLSQNITTALEPLKSYWLKYTGTTDCQLGSGGVSLMNIENQLASVSQIISQIIDKIKDLLGR